MPSLMPMCEPCHAHQVTSHRLFVIPPNIDHSKHPQIPLVNKEKTAWGRDFSAFLCLVKVSISCCGFYTAKLRLWKQLICLKQEGERGWKKSVFPLFSWFREWVYWSHQSFGFSHWIPSPPSCQSNPLRSLLPPLLLIGQAAKFPPHDSGKINILHCTAKKSFY